MNQTGPDEKSAMLCAEVLFIDQFLLFFHIKSQSIVKINLQSNITANKHASDPKIKYFTRFCS